MGFLDHTTNNIIVDAVLTDEGRKKLASASGLSIIKYAFADTEVDYTLLKKYGEVVGREKIEKNTPIYEANTNGTHPSRHSLLTDSAAANVETIVLTNPTPQENGTTNKTYQYNFQFKNFDPNTEVFVDIVYTHAAWEPTNGKSNDYLVGDPDGLLKRATLNNPVSTNEDGVGTLLITMDDSVFSSGTKNAAFELLERGGVSSSVATKSISK